MADDRYLYLGLAARHGGGWALRRRLSRWSPRRALALALLALLPTRVLGFATWRAGRWYLRRRLRVVTNPGPVMALGLLALLFAGMFGRDRLPAPVAAYLPSRP